MDQWLPVAVCVIMMLSNVCLTLPPLLCSTDASIGYSFRDFSSHPSLSPKSGLCHPPLPATLPLPYYQLHLSAVQSLFRFCVRKSISPRRSGYPRSSLLRESSAAHLFSLGFSKSGISPVIADQITLPLFRPLDFQLSSIYTYPFGLR